MNQQLTHTLRSPRFQPRTALLLLVIIGIFTMLLGTLTPISGQQSKATGLAGVMPGDTGIYVELSTTDLKGNVETLLDQIGRLNGVPIPSMLVYLSVDQALSRVLGAPATLDSDVLS